jgi:hypothetical protein
MKIAFIAHRANYLKHYGPIIDAALRRGWQPECWVQDVEQKGKAYLRIRPEMVQRIWPDRVNVENFETSEEIPMLAKRSRVDALISLHTRNFYQADRAIRFITLQHSVDTFIDSHNDLASSDFLCLFSPFWWDYAQRYYAEASSVSQSELRGTLLSKVVFTGFPQMDAFARIDAAKIRERLGISPDQKVVLALPIDLSGWSGSWPNFFAAGGLKQWQALLRSRNEANFVRRYWQWALRGWNDNKLANSISVFCKKNDALFMIKGREKDPLRKAWLSRANRAFYDESHYPPTAFEAIAISSLCILFYSTAAQEAAYAGVPSLCVDRPNRDLLKHRLWRVNTVGGPYNFPGVVDWMTLPKVMTEFQNRSIREFHVDQAARQKYLEIYNGPADHRASERVLDLLQ